MKQVVKWTAEGVVKSEIGNLWFSSSNIVLTSAKHESRASDESDFWVCNYRINIHPVFYDVRHA